MAKRRKPELVANFAESKDKAKAEAMAKLALRPSANAAAVVVEYGKAFGEQDIGALTDALRETIDQARDGNMQRAEAMLLGQADALQAIFVSLARRATRQEYVKNFDTFLRLALKAQSQCRATLETLAEIKHPKSATFVNQQNVAYQQQVNNGAPANQPHDAPARTEKTINQSNELLSEDTHATLDTRGTRAASNAYQTVETVGTVNRGEDR